MQKIFNSKSYKWIVSILAILFLIFSFIQIVKNNKKSSDLKGYKTLLVQTDSLYKDSKNTYTKLVLDFETTKSLNKGLKSENKDLHASIKEARGKTIITQFIEATALQTIDTIYIPGKTIRDTVEVFKNFRSYYPNKEESFANFSIYEEGGSLLEKWHFDTLNIDLAIIEKEKDIFYVKSNAPSWLQITKIDVKSLPLSPIKKDNFDFVLGTGFGRDFRNNNFVYSGEVGLRYKKSILTIQAQTNNTVFFGYKKLL